MVVDQDDAHVYQPGLLFVPFGLTHSRRDHPPASASFTGGIEYHQTAIDRVDLDTSGSGLERRDGPRVRRARRGHRPALVPEETEGLTGPGWMEKIFTF